MWAWITDSARWRPHEFQTRFGVVTLGRGQILVSERSIAEDFGLGRQQVRRLMDSLEIASMISRNSTHGASRAGTIVTVLNYEKYQTDSGPAASSTTQGQPANQPKTNPRPTQDQPTREEREEREEGEKGKIGAASRGSRLAADWSLPKEWRDWAAADRGWDAGTVKREAEKFADHWWSAAGRTAIKVDWLAAWRLWCRRASEMAGGSRSGRSDEGYSIGGTPMSSPC